MHCSTSICSGVLGYFQEESYLAWKANKYDVCMLVGMTVMHRFDTPKKIKIAFDLTREAARSGACLRDDIHNYTKIDMAKQCQFGMNDWTKNFQNFFDRLRKV